jgi:hypothetical protein
MDGYDTGLISPAKRQDPELTGHGTGLIPSSAPMMQEIADFWRDFHGLGR